MHRSVVVFTVLCVSILSALAAPLSYGQSLEKRDISYGRGTWFRVGLGACGGWNSDSDSIVAISDQIYGNGKNCGQWVRVTNTATGSTAFGLTRDECAECGSGDLDMSPGLFGQLGDLDIGVLAIAWNFMPLGWSPPS